MSKTGLMIDYDNIVKPSRLDKLCNKIQPIQESDRYQNCLILVIPEHQLNLLELIPKGVGRVNYINTDSFVSSIEGHAWIVYDRRKKVCELREIRGTLTKPVLDIILWNIPNDVTVWVGIPVENRNILELIETYSIFGFKNPYVCRTSPLGQEFPSYGLCLLKPNNVTEPEDSNEAKYILDQFVKREQQNCQISLKFSDKALRHLKQMSKIGSTLNKDNSISQKEIAGSFKLEKSLGDSVFSLKINKKSIISGEEQTVKVVDSIYNFHTHPVEAYKTNGVKIGWPSAQDYIAFLASAKINGTILHAIVSVEGVYILSIGNHWINRISEIGSSVKTFINKEYNIKSYSGRDVDWYINKVNSLYYEGFPIFFVQFFRWEDASSVFHVSFKRNDMNCFARERTLERFENLYR